MVGWLAGQPVRVHWKKFIEFMVRLEQQNREISKESENLEFPYCIYYIVFRREGVFGCTNIYIQAESGLATSARPSALWHCSRYQ